MARSIHVANDDALSQDLVSEGRVESGRRSQYFPVKWNDYGYDS